jgi:DNA-binding NtrC family response regulator
MKILIVDDEENVLGMLKKALKMDDEIEIITAQTIEDAEYAITNMFFDLVISDIKLTGVLGREGLELLPYITEKSPKTQVIIMTGYGSPEIEAEAYARGAYYYFEKPIDLGILIGKVSGLKKRLMAPIAGRA